MTAASSWDRVGTALVVGMASAALAWRDCVLLAVSLVLTHRLLLVRMDRGAPWRVLAAVANALLLGIATSGAGVVLLAGMVAALLGWWQTTTEHVWASLLLLSAGALWCCLSRRNESEAWQEIRPWLWLVAGLLLASESHHRGLAFAPCLLVAAVALVLIRAGWRLATATTSSLLQAGHESH